MDLSDLKGQLAALQKKKQPPPERLLQMLKNTGFTGEWHATSKKLLPLLDNPNQIANIGSACVSFPGAAEAKAQRRKEKATRTRHLNSALRSHGIDPADWKRMVKNNHSLTADEFRALVDEYLAQPDAATRKAFSQRQGKDRT